ncbi:Ti-type conjugative transfer relaxase TraA [Brucella thiophenivorans]|nr:Ti-type conjugative transfer relaxase TraA [Brucella thiophenivorans]
MAIYHFSMKDISVARGQSAVAAAAYRRAEIMQNQATGQWSNYRNKSEVVYSEFSIPANSPAWVLKLSDKTGRETSQDFWSLVENDNNRSNAKYANEIVMALPTELTTEQNIDLVREFVNSNLTSRGLVSDWSYHDKSNNPHVHILVSTKPLINEGFGTVYSPKLDSEGNAQRNEKGSIQYERFGLGRTDLRTLRQEWASVQNKHLALNGHDIRVDHRSHEELGIDLVPTEHIGVHAKAIHDKGGHSDRVLRNEEIKAINNDIVLNEPELILQKLTTQQSVFTDKDIAREIFRYTNSRKDFQELQLRIGASDELIALQAPVFDPVTDKEISPAIYTTKTVFENEYTILEAANKLNSNDTFYVSEKRLNSATQSFEKAAGFSLTDEQKAIIRYSTSNNGIATIVGYAGAGKSTVMNVVREAYEKNGSRVFGAALAGVAVDGLKQSSGINSRTIASWEANWKNGKRELKSGDVFVLDEAGMVSSDQMKTIIEHVSKADAKLILVGDHRQLQPIMSGAAFRGIADNVGYKELTGIIRQRVDYQRQASLLLAEGQTSEALNGYNQTGHIHIKSNTDASHTSLISDWSKSWQAGGDALILAHKNIDVVTLNRLARQEIQSHGGLADEVAITTSQGTDNFAIGDKIIFLQGDFKTGLRNGTTAFITALDADTNQITVEADNGNTVEFNSLRYNSFTHGYAQTVHKSQGKTVDDAFVYASNSMDAQLTYVALTRHRNNVGLYASNTDFKNTDALVSALSRDRQKSVSFIHSRTQDYADALKDFMDRRGVGSVSDWKQSLITTLSTWREKLTSVAQRLKDYGVNTLHITPLKSQALELPLKVDTPLSVGATNDLISDKRHEISVVPNQNAIKFDLSDELLQVSNRLSHAFDHADLVDMDKARRNVITASRNAVRGGLHSTEINSFMDNVKSIIPMQDILKVGKEFDPQILDKHLAALPIEDKAQIENYWPHIHNFARAEMSIGQVEVASLVQTDLKENAVVADYAKGMDRWHSPDIPLIPGITMFKESIEQSVERIVKSNPSVQAFEHVARDHLANTFVNAPAVGDMFIEHIQKRDNALDVIQDLGRNPATYGDIIGKKSFIGRANSERQGALDNLPIAVSALTDYAQRYTTLKGNVTVQETEFREIIKTPTPELSPLALQFIEQIKSPDTNFEAVLFSQEGKIARSEIQEFVSSVQARFGDFSEDLSSNERFTRISAHMEPEAVEKIVTQLQTAVSADSRVTWLSNSISQEHAYKQSQEHGHGQDL